MASDESSPVQPPRLDPALRQQVVRWLWHWCGRLTVLALAAWTLALWLLIAGFHFWGEANPFTAFLLFLPSAIWTFPGVILWPATLLFRWRAALILAVLAAPGVLLMSPTGPGTPPAPSPPDQRPSDVLVVLTNNRGQNGGHSLRPFKNHIQPDLMAFQESSVPAQSYLADPGYGEFTHGQSIGEFTLLSRFPVSPGRLLTWSGDAATGSLRYAARFEVDWNGRSIAVYVVHLRSPRGSLLAMRGGAFLYGLPLPLDRWRQRSKDVGGFWHDQVAVAEELIRQVKADPLPCLLAGDFNAPHLGAIHRRLAGHFQDAHAEAGTGSGFTFPGETRNPLAFRDAWLRIDYVFADPHWEVSTCWTEAERRSQHRAVAAALRWKPGH